MGFLNTDLPSHPWLTLTAKIGFHENTDHIVYMIASVMPASSGTNLAMPFTKVLYVHAHSEFEAHCRGRSSCGPLPVAGVPSSAPGLLTMGHWFGECQPVGI